MIAIATCLDLPHPDEDEPHLLAALAAAGVDARVAAWDDAAVDWARFDAVVIRSTWNYVPALDAFLTWTDAVERVTPLVNPAPVVRWNAHKRYLVELGDRGLPVVPTRIVDRGHEWGRALDEAFAASTEVVIKPAVSAGSFATIRVRSDERPRAIEHLAAHVPERDMMLQPFLRSVETTGERCLVWIDGAFTHAVRKRARFAGDEASITPVAIEADERATAERVLRAAPPGIRYARVDLARDEHGEPQLMELELIEPALFLADSPAGMQRFVALARALSGPPGDYGPAAADGSKRPSAG
jgi:hypothetical protein